VVRRQELLALAASRDCGLVLECWLAATVGETSRMEVLWVLQREHPYAGK